MVFLGSPHQGGPQRKHKEILLSFLFSFFEVPPRGALSENLRKPRRFIEPPSQGALSKNARNSYDFPAVTPGGPQRKRKEILCFPEVLPGGGLSENVRKSCSFPAPQGALSENLRKSYGCPAAPQGGPQRKPEEIFCFPEVTPGGGPSAKT